MQYDNLEGMCAIKKGGSRIEGHKDPLIKHHGTVAICHADFAVRRMPVNDFSRRDIAGVKCCL